MTNKEYTTFIGFKSLFYFCALPLRLDSYRGCTYNCLYCFSQHLNNRNYDFFKNPIPANPNKLKNIFNNLNKNNKNLGLVNSCLQHKLPIHFGSVSDPFQPCEKKYKVSLNFLKILNNENYPIIISTKSNLLLDDQYINLIKDTPSVVQISFSTFDDKLAKKIEPNAPSPSERLKTLEILSKKGIFTVIRIQPYLFPLIDVNEIDFKKFSSIGIKHIVLEHLRIPTNSSLKSREKLFNNLGLNILDFYKEMGLKISRINYELSSNEKLNQIIIAKKRITECGMTFGSGDNDFHHLSDHPCCCGIPNTPEFENYYKGNFTFAIYHSIKTKQELNFNNISKQWQPNGSVCSCLNSDCRNHNNYSIQNVLLDKLNNPESSNSPKSFWGVDFKDNNYFINDELKKL